MTILVEKHKNKCTCSYCKGEHKLHYGLNIPINWQGWNSWYVIKISARRYFRWTNRWFKFFLKEKDLKIKKNSIDFKNCGNES